MAADPPVRWGLLGTGGITRKILAGAAGTPSVELVAVGSRTRERAEAYAAEHGIPRAHASYDDLLADEDVEAIYISLPNALHHEWTMAALAAGKHVLCEKPYSQRPADVDEAFGAAAAAGLVLSEAFMWRHHPQVTRMLEILPELGALQTIRTTFSYVMSDGPDVRLDAGLEGGSLLDVGTYCVNAARLVAGEEPDLAFGSAVVGPARVDLRFTGVLRFPSGVMAEFTCGFSANHRGLEAFGTEGSVLLTDPWHAAPAVIVRDGVETPIEPADPYRLELEDVGRAIRTGRPPLVGWADAIGQARTLAALLLSAETGQPVVP